MAFDINAFYGIEDEDEEEKRRQERKTIFNAEVSQNLQDSLTESLGLNVPLAPDVTQQQNEASVQQREGELNEEGLEKVRQIAGAQQDAGLGVKPIEMLGALGNVPLQKSSLPIPNEDTPIAELTDEEKRYEEYKNSLTGIINIFQERQGGNIISGALRSIEGMSGFAEFLSTSQGEPELGMAFHNIGEGLNDIAQGLEPKDMRTFVDDVFSGVGSMATFLLPSAGISAGLKGLDLGVRLSSAIGMGTMTGLEAMTEAGQIYRETGDPEATMNSFGMNVVALAITNKLGLFGKSQKMLNRALRSAPLEGIQEGSQEVISAVVKDEEINIDNVIRASGVGAVVGGGASVFIPEGLAGVERYDGDMLEKISIAHSEQGGTSTLPSGGKATGYSVGTQEGTGQVIKGKKVSKEELQKFVVTHNDELSDPDNFIGTWYDPLTDETHIDVSTTTKSKDKAMKIARKNKQTAIYDLNNGEVVNVTKEDGKSLVMRLRDRYLNNNKRPPAGGASAVVDLQKTGQQNEAFFTEKSEEPSSRIDYQPVIEVDMNTPVGKDYQTFSAEGNFTGHISKMIPSFAEKQKQVAEGIVKSDAKSFLDIGTSEGGMIKTVSNNSNIESVGVDPNSQMKKNFESTPPVEGATFKQQAFQASWTEADGTFIKELKSDQKFDVVNEDFAFQFMNNDRASQVEEVKSLMNPEGVFITSEKFHTDNSRSNEQRKLDHQRKYFNESELTEDKQTIVTGMAEDMVNDKDYEKILQDNFKHVEEFWNAGDFKGYIASDSEVKLQKMKDDIGDLDNEFADKEDSEAPTLADTISGKWKSTVERAEEKLKGFGSQFYDVSTILNPALAVSFVSNMAIVVTDRLIKTQTPFGTVSEFTRMLIDEYEADFPIVRRYAREIYEQAKKIRGKVKHNPLTTEQSEEVMNVIQHKMRNGVMEEFIPTDKGIIIVGGDMLDFEGDRRKAVGIRFPEDQSLKASDSEKVVVKESTVVGDRIVNAELEGVGSVTAQLNDDGTIQFRGSGIAESAKGTGRGIMLYEKIIDYAIENGFKKIGSDFSISKSAEKIYTEALPKRGFKVTKSNKATVRRAGNKEFLMVSDRSEPVYTVELPDQKPRRAGKSHPIWATDKGVARQIEKHANKGNDTIVFMAYANAWNAVFSNYSFQEMLRSKVVTELGENNTPKLVSEDEWRGRGSRVGIHPSSISSQATWLAYEKAIKKSIAKIKKSKEGIEKKQWDGNSLAMKFAVENGINLAGKIVGVAKFLNLNHGNDRIDPHKQYDTEIEGFNYVSLEQPIDYNFVNTETEGSEVGAEGKIPLIENEVMKERARRQQMFRIIQQRGLPLRADQSALVNNLMDLSNGDNSGLNKWVSEHEDFAGEIPDPIAHEEWLKGNKIKSEQFRKEADKSLHDFLGIPMKKIKMTSVAFRNAITGQIIKGKTGQMHTDLLQSEGLLDKQGFATQKTLDELESGFLGSDGEFYTRRETEKVTGVGGESVTQGVGGSGVQYLAPIGSLGLLNPQVWKGLSVVGKAVARGAKSFAKWSMEMINQVGEWVRPMLRSLWAQVTQTPSNVFKKASQKEINHAIDPEGQIQMMGKTAEEAEVERKENLKSDHRVGTLPSKSSGYNMDKEHPKLQNILIPTIEALRNEFDLQRRGTIDNNELMKRAQRRAEKLTDRDILELNRGDVKNAEDVLAMRIYLTDQMLKVSDEIKANATATDGILIKNMADELTRVMRMWQNVRALGTEAGRVVQSLNIPMDDTIIEGMRDMAGLMNQLDPEGRYGGDIIETMIKQVINDKNSGKPQSKWMTGWEVARFGFLNWILQNPLTDIANIHGNLTNLSFHVVANIGNLGGAKTLAKGVKLGFKEGVKDAMEVLHGEREAISKFTEGSKVELPSAKGRKGLNYAKLFVPTTRLGMEDAFFRAMARNIETERMVVKTSMKLGVSPDEVSNAVTDLINNPELETYTRKDYVELLRYLERIEDQLVFQQELGRFGKAMAGASRVIFPIIPFVTTPANLLKAGIGATPLGLIQLGKKVITQEEKNQVIRKALAGSVFMAGVGALIAQGVVEITGGGSDDEYERDLMEKMGYKPNHIYINTPFGKFGGGYMNINPLNTMFTVMGDLLDQYRFRKFDKPEDEKLWHDKAIETMTTMLLGIGTSISEQSFLQGVKGFMDFLSGRRPDWALRMFTNFARVGAIQGVQRITGTEDRGRFETKGKALDQLQKTFPLADNEGLIESVSTFGEQRQSQYERFPLPITKVTPEPALDFLIENGLRVRQPTDGTKLENRAMSDKELEFFRKGVGQLMSKVIVKLYESQQPQEGKEIEQLNEEELQDKLDTAYESAKKFVKKQLKKKIIKQFQEQEKGEQ